MASSRAARVVQLFDRRVLLVALPVAAAHVGMLVTGDLAAHPWAFLVWVAVAVAGLAWSARRLAGRAAVGVSIVAVAALLRLLLCWLPPTLSDDVYRYVWDGRVAASGFDPYLLAPESPELAGLRDDNWRRLPHRDVPTVYPPFALALFSIAARLPAPVAALKALLAAADLLTCVLLLALARRLGVGEERVVWYAWNPLATVEIAGMGHVDGLGVLAVVATVWLLVRAPRRAPAAALTAAAAVLAKLVPILALPAWARSSGRPLPFAALALAVVGLALAPLALAAGGVPPGLVTYGVSWEFNGPLYEPLWRLLDTADVPAAVEGWLDRRKLADGRHDFWNRFYPYNYPQLEAKLLLAPALLAGLALAWRHRRPAVATAAVFATLVLFSATVYPWYVLWVLPWAALLAQPAWRLLAASVSLCYLPQFTSLELVPWVYLAIWAPFFALLVWRPRWSTG